MLDLILIVILLGIIGGNAYYLYKAKKRGQACVGCPCSKQCSGKCSGCNQK